MTHSVAIVIPTVGRPSLAALLDSLTTSAEVCSLPIPPVVVVDDRPEPRSELDLPAGAAVTVLRSGGRGPAAARNAGWRSVDTTWVAFLDDDVLVTPGWLADLDRDLNAAPVIAGSQGRIIVPLPSDRRPTDWERGTAGLATALWITADMAYRRSVLAAVDGFDERFPRAFREDADLALRVLAADSRLEHGSRQTVHPVRPAAWWASVRQQRGNADDVLMRRLHGPGWRRRAAAPLGRRPAHIAVSAFGVIALAAIGIGRRRLAAGAFAGWLLGTAEFAWRRLRPGPWGRAETLAMLATSAAIPPAATWYWLAGRWRHRAVRRGPGSRSGVGDGRHPSGVLVPSPEAVLVDRDGTLVRDVPYNGDPALVNPMPTARAALARLRAAGLPIVVISNQSGVGRGLLSMDEVRAVNTRIEELLGPFHGWVVCPHTAEDGCSCRKPAPGMVFQASRLLGVAPDRCVVVGDIGADMACAAAAGATGILVPTEVTRPDEINAAPVRVVDLAAAADLILGSPQPVSHVAVGS